jgi:hypothetical protein
MTYYLFLSYAHADKRLCYKTAQILNQQGFYTWLDKELKVGQNWRQVLAERVRASAGVVVLLTPESVSSPDCAAEWQDAIDSGIPLYPLMLKECTPPYPITQYHWVGPTNFDAATVDANPDLIFSAVFELIQGLGHAHPAHTRDLWEYFSVKAGFNATVQAQEQFRGVKGVLRRLTNRSEKEQTEQTSTYYFQRMQELERKLDRAYMVDEWFLPF